MIEGQIESIGSTAYLDSKQQPSDGGAFERVIAGIPFAAVKMFAGDIADITTAHNADRAADKQRIAELEKRLLIAEENQRFHRANIEKSADGSLNICWGEHEKWEDCEYVRYYPEQRIAESPPVAGSETEPEPDFTGRVAELEAALKLAMDWLDDDVPKYIVDELINSLR